MASSAHAGTVLPARPARGIHLDVLVLRRTALRLARYAVMVVLAVFFLLPYVWMVSGSLRTQNEIFANLQPLSVWTFVPKQWTLSGFQALLELQPFPFTHYVWNSLIVAVTVTVLSLIVNSFAAYVFARIKFPGRDVLFVAFLATMVIPFEILAIPLYIEMRMFHWVDTYQALIVPFVASPVGMFLLRQFFLGLPRELEDAARIDGCSLFGAFWRVVLPNATPALIACAAEFRRMRMGDFRVTRSLTKRADPATSASVPGGRSTTPARTATSDAESSTFVAMRIGRSDSRTQRAQM